MRYDYKLTYKDFLDAQRLFRKQRWTSALSYYVFIWGLPVLGFLAAVPWFAQLLGAQAQWVYAWGGFAALGLWCAIAIPLMRIYTIRRCWKRLLPDSAEKSIRSEIRPASGYSRSGSVQLTTCLSLTETEKWLSRATTSSLNGLSGVTGSSEGASSV